MMLNLYQKIDKNRVMQDLEITELTFKRYIQELRAFFSNFNLDMDIKYIREYDAYLLEKY